MKTLLTFILFVFSIIYSNAQDLLLSEDFDYPIGSTLNQHNWKPLTSATDNPIKIVSGLSKEGYSASGGAAYLNKNGQDVIRSFAKVSEGTIYLSFQLNIKEAYKDFQYYYEQAKTPSPSNYFMFLSSKEEPLKPLLKFSIIDYGYSYGGFNADFRNMKIYVLDAHNQVLGQSFNTISTETNTVTLNFSYTLTGENEGMSQMGIDSPNIFYTTYKNKKNKLKIANITNIVLSQSDINVGSKVVIDRIKISKSWGSIMPCTQIYKKISIGGCIPFYTGNGSTCGQLPVDNDLVFSSLPNATTPSTYAFSITPILSPAIIEVPEGFRVSINGNTPTSKAIIPLKINDTDYASNFYTPSDIKIYFVGNSKKIGSNGIPLVGGTGNFGGNVTIKAVGGECNLISWKIQGMIKSTALLNSEMASFNAIIFPNTTDGKLDLLINNKAPEGEIDVKLSDNAGNNLYQNTGNWDSLKANIEQILSKNRSGQYFFTVKQENESKTIRLFKQ